ncbi:MAG: hypothetical protein H7833_05350 [Magnetococcus sp. DMHC-1]
MVPFILVDPESALLPIRLEYDMQPWSALPIRLEYDMQSWSALPIRLEYDMQS